VGEVDEEAFNCLEGFMVVDSVGEDDDDSEFTFFQTKIELAKSLEEV